MPNITLTRVPLIVALVLLVLFPLVSSTFYLQLGAKIMIMAIFALSLDLLVGHAGMVSLGHAAYFGVATESIIIDSDHWRHAFMLLGLLVCLIQALVFCTLTMVYIGMAMEHEEH